MIVCRKRFTCKCKTLREKSTFLQKYNLRLEGHFLGFLPVFRSLIEAHSDPWRLTESQERDPRVLNCRFFNNFCLPFFSLPFIHVSVCYFSLCLLFFYMCILLLSVCHYCVCLPLLSLSIIILSACYSFLCLLFFSLPSILLPRPTLLSLHEDILF